MTPLALSGKALLAAGIGAVVSGVLQTSQTAGVGVTEIVDGVIIGTVVFLFSMLIRLGNQHMAGKVYAERNKTDIDRLDAESRTVDKRIQDSRHALRNEVQMLTASVEERLIGRMDENMRAVTRLEERLNHFLEEQNAPKRRT